MSLKEIIIQSLPPRRKSFFSDVKRVAARRIYDGHAADDQSSSQEALAEGYIHNTKHQRFVAIGSFYP
jgi:hypothetical protein